MNLNLLHTMINGYKYSLLHQLLIILFFISTLWVNRILQNSNWRVTSLSPCFLAAANVSFPGCCLLGFFLSLPLTSAFCLFFSPFSSFSALTSKLMFNFTTLSSKQTSILGGKWSKVLPSSLPPLLPQGWGSARLRSKAHSTPAEGST